MPLPSAGTVIHWRDYVGTHGKYLLVIGCAEDEQFVLALTVTTQEHWLRDPICKAAMIEIPQGATRFLSKRSFINCHFPIERISHTQYEQACYDKLIDDCGKLRDGYLTKVRDAIDNDLMSGIDIADAIAAIDRKLPRATSET